MATEVNIPEDSSAAQAQGENRHSKVAQVDSIPDEHALAGSTLNQTLIKMPENEHKKWVEFQDAATGSEKNEVISDFNAEEQDHGMANDAPNISKLSCAEEPKIKIHEGETSTDTRSFDQHVEEIILESMEKEIITLDKDEISRSKGEKDSNLEECREQATSIIEADLGAKNDDNVIVEESYIKDEDTENVCSKNSIHIEVEEKDIESFQSSNKLENELKHERTEDTSINIAETPYIHHGEKATPEGASNNEDDNNKKLENQPSDLATDEVSTLGVALEAEESLTEASSESHIEKKKDIHESKWQDINVPPVDEINKAEDSTLLKSNERGKKGEGTHQIGVTEINKDRKINPKQDDGDKRVSWQPNEQQGKLGGDFVLVPEKSEISAAGENVEMSTEKLQPDYEEEDKEEPALTSNSHETFSSTEKNLPLVESITQSASAEIEVPEKNGNDLNSEYLVVEKTRGEHSGEIVEFITGAQEKNQESSKPHGNNEEETEYQSEARKGTVSEDTSSEGAVVKETILQSNKAVEEQGNVLESSNSDETLEIRDGRKIIPDKANDEEEDTDIQTQKTATGSVSEDEATIRNRTTEQSFREESTKDAEPTSIDIENHRPETDAERNTEATAAREEINRQHTVPGSDEETINIFPVDENKSQNIGEGTSGEVEEENNESDFPSKFTEESNQNVESPDEVLDISLKKQEESVLGEVSEKNAEDEDKDENIKPTCEEYSEKMLQNDENEKVEEVADITTDESKAGASGESPESTDSIAEEETRTTPEKISEKEEKIKSINDRKENEAENQEVQVFETTEASQATVESILEVCEKSKRDAPESKDQAKEMENAVVSETLSSVPVDTEQGKKFPEEDESCETKIKEEVEEISLTGAKATNNSDEFSEPKEDNDALNTEENNSFDEVSTSTLGVFEKDDFSIKDSEAASLEDVSEKPAMKEVKSSNEDQLEAYDASPDMNDSTTIETKENSLGSVDSDETREEKRDMQVPAVADEGGLQIPHDIKDQAPITSTPILEVQLEQTFVDSDMSPSKEDHKTTDQTIAGNNDSNVTAETPSTVHLKGSPDNKDNPDEENDYKNTVEVLPREQREGEKFIVMADQNEANKFDIVEGEKSTVELVASMDSENAVLEEEELVERTEDSPEVVVVERGLEETTATPKRISQKENTEENNNNLVEISTSTLGVFKKGDLIKNDSAAASLGDVSETSTMKKVKSLNDEQPETSDASPDMKDLTITETKANSPVSVDIDECQEKETEQEEFREVEIPEAEDESRYHVSHDIKDQALITGINDETTTTALLEVQLEQTLVDSDTVPSKEDSKTIETGKTISREDALYVDADTPSIAPFEGSSNDKKKNADEEFDQKNTVEDKPIEQREREPVMDLGDQNKANKLEIVEDEKSTAAVSNPVEVFTSMNNENAVLEEKELAKRTEESSEVPVVEKERQEEATATLQRIPQKENIEEKVKATDDTKENEAENQEVHVFEITESSQATTENILEVCERPKKDVSESKTADKEINNTVENGTLPSASVGIEKGENESCETNFKEVEETITNTSEDFSKSREDNDALNIEQNNNNLVEVSTSSLGASEKDDISINNSEAESLGIVSEKPAVDEVRSLNEEQLEASDASPDMKDFTAIETTADSQGSVDIDEQKEKETDIEEFAEIITDGSKADASGENLESTEFTAEETITTHEEISQKEEREEKIKSTDDGTKENESENQEAQVFVTTEEIQATTENTLEVCEKSKIDASESKQEDQEIENTVASGTLSSVSVVTEKGKEFPEENESGDTKVEKTTLTDTKVTGTLDNFAESNTDNDALTTEENNNKLAESSTSTLGVSEKYDYSTNDSEALHLGDASEKPATEEAKSINEEKPEIYDASPDIKDLTTIETKANSLSNVDIDEMEEKETNKEEKLDMEVPVVADEGEKEISHDTKDRDLSTGTPLLEVQLEKTFVDSDMVLSKEDPETTEMSMTTDKTTAGDDVSHIDADTAFVADVKGSSDNKKDNADEEIEGKNTGEGQPVEQKEREQVTALADQNEANEMEIDKDEKWAIEASKHIEVVSMNSESTVLEEEELTERTGDNSVVVVVEREGQEETYATLERISQKESIEENVAATDDTKENETQNQEVLPATTVGSEATVENNLKVCKSSKTQASESKPEEDIENIVGTLSSNSVGTGTGKEYPEENESDETTMEKEVEVTNAESENQTEVTNLTERNISNASDDIPEPNEDHGASTTEQNSHNLVENSPSISEVFEKDDKSTNGSESESIRVVSENTAMKEGNTENEEQLKGSDAVPDMKDLLTIETKAISSSSSNNEERQEEESSLENVPEIIEVISHEAPICKDERPTVEVSQHTEVSTDVNNESASLEAEEPSERTAKSSALAVIGEEKEAAEPKAGSPSSEEEPAISKSSEPLIEKTLQSDESQKSELAEDKDKDAMIKLKDDVTNANDGKEKVEDFSEMNSEGSKEETKITVEKISQMEDREENEERSIDDTKEMEAANKEIPVTDAAGQATRENDFKVCEISNTEAPVSKPQEDEIENIVGTSSASVSMEAGKQHRQVEVTYVESTEQIESTSLMGRKTSIPLDNYLEPKEDHGSLTTEENNNFVDNASPTAGALEKHESDIIDSETEILGVTSGKTTLKCAKPVNEEQLEGSEVATRTKDVTTIEREEETNSEENKSMEVPKGADEGLQQEPHPIEEISEITGLDHEKESSINTPQLDEQLVQTNVESPMVPAKEEPEITEPSKTAEDTPARDEEKEREDGRDQKHKDQEDHMPFDLKTENDISGTEGTEQLQREQASGLEDQNETRELEIVKDKKSSVGLEEEKIAARTEDNSAVAGVEREAVELKEGTPSSEEAPARTKSSEPLAEVLSVTDGASQATRENKVSKTSNTDVSVSKTQEEEIENIEGTTPSAPVDIETEKEYPQVHTSETKLHPEVEVTDAESSKEQIEATSLIERQFSGTIDNVSELKEDHSDLTTEENNNNLVDSASLAARVFEKDESNKTDSATELIGVMSDKTTLKCDKPVNEEQLEGSDVATQTKDVTKIEREEEETNSEENKSMEVPEEADEGLQQEPHPSEEIYEITGLDHEKESTINAPQLDEQLVQTNVESSMVPQKEEPEITEPSKTAEETSARDEEKEREDGRDQKQKDQDEHMPLNLKTENDISDTEDTEQLQREQVSGLEDQNEISELEIVKDEKSSVGLAEKIAARTEDNSAVAGADREAAGLKDGTPSSEEGPARTKRSEHLAEEISVTEGASKATGENKVSETLNTEVPVSKTQEEEFENIVRTIPSAPVEIETEKEYPQVHTSEAKLQQEVEVTDTESSKEQIEATSLIKRQISSTVDNISELKEDHGDLTTEENNNLVDNASPVARVFEKDESNKTDSETELICVTSDKTILIDDKPVNEDQLEGSDAPTQTKDVTTIETKYSSSVSDERQEEETNSEENKIMEVSKVEDEGLKRVSHHKEEEAGVTGLHHDKESTASTPQLDEQLVQTEIDSNMVPSKEEPEATESSKTTQEKSTVEVSKDIEVVTSTNDKVVVVEEEELAERTEDNSAVAGVEREAAKLNEGTPSIDEQPAKTKSSEPQVKMVEDKNEESKEPNEVIFLIERNLNALDELSEPKEDHDALTTEENNLDLVNNSSTSVEVSGKDKSCTNESSVASSKEGETIESSKATEDTPARDEVKEREGDSDQKHKDEDQDMPSGLKTENYILGTEDIEQLKREQVSGLKDQNEASELEIVKDEKSSVEVSKDIEVATSINSKNDTHEEEEIDARTEENSAVAGVEREAAELKEGTASSKEGPARTKSSELLAKEISVTDGTSQATGENKASETSSTQIPASKAQEEEIENIVGTIPSPSVEIETEREYPQAPTSETKLQQEVEVTEAESSKEQIEAISLIERQFSATRDNISWLKEDHGDLTTEENNNLVDSASHVARVFEEDESNKTDSETQLISVMSDKTFLKDDKPVNEDQFEGSDAATQMKDVTTIETKYSSSLSDERQEEETNSEENKIMKVPKVEDEGLQKVSHHIEEEAEITGLHHEKESTAHPPQLDEQLVQTEIDSNMVPSKEEPEITESSRTTEEKSTVEVSKDIEVVTSTDDKAVVVEEKELAERTKDNSAEAGVEREVAELNEGTPSIDEQPAKTKSSELQVKKVEDVNEESKEQNEMTSLIERNLSDTSDELSESKEDHGASNTEENNVDLVDNSSTSVGVSEKDENSTNESSVVSSKKEAETIESSKATEDTTERDEEKERDSGCDQKHKDEDEDMPSGLKTENYILGTEDIEQLKREKVSDLKDQNEASELEIVKDEKSSAEVSKDIEVVTSINSKNDVHEEEEIDARTEDNSAVDGVEREVAELKKGVPTSEEEPTKTKISELLEEKGEITYEDNKPVNKDQSKVCDAAPHMKDVATIETKANSSIVNNDERQEEETNSEENRNMKDPEVTDESGQKMPDDNKENDVITCIDQSIGSSKTTEERSALDEKSTSFEISKGASTLASFDNEKDNADGGDQKHKDQYQLMSPAQESKDDISDADQIEMRELEIFKDEKSVGEVLKHIEDATCIKGEETVLKEGEHTERTKDNSVVIRVEEEPAELKERSPISEEEPTNAKNSELPLEKGHDAIETAENGSIKKNLMERSIISAEEEGTKVKVLDSEFKQQTKATELTEEKESVTLEDHTKQNINTIDISSLTSADVSKTSNKDSSSTSEVYEREAAAAVLNKDELTVDDDTKHMSGTVAIEETCLKNVVPEPEEQDKGSDFATENEYVATILTQRTISDNKDIHERQEEDFSTEKKGSLEEADNCHLEIDKSTSEQHEQEVTPGLVLNIQNYPQQSPEEMDANAAEITDKAEETHATEHTTENKFPQNEPEVTKHHVYEVETEKSDASENFPEQTSEPASNATESDVVSAVDNIVTEVTARNSESIRQIESLNNFANANEDVSSLTTIETSEEETFGEESKQTLLRDSDNKKQKADEEEQKHMDRDELMPPDLKTAHVILSTEDIEQWKREQVSGLADQNEAYEVEKSTVEVPKDVEVVTSTDDKHVLKEHDLTERAEEKSAAIGVEREDAELEERTLSCEDKPVKTNGSELLAEKVEGIYKESKNQKGAPDDIPEPKEGHRTYITEEKHDNLVDNSSPSVKVLEKDENSANDSDNAAIEDSKPVNEDEVEVSVGAVETKDVTIIRTEAQSSSVKNDKRKEEETVNSEEAQGSSKTTEETAERDDSFYVDAKTTSFEIPEGDSILENSDNKKEIADEGDQQHKDQDQHISPNPKSENDISDIEDIEQRKTGQVSGSAHQNETHKLEIVKDEKSVDEVSKHIEHAACIKDEETVLEKDEHTGRTEDSAALIGVEGESTEPKEGSIVSEEEPTNTENSELLVEKVHHTVKTADNGNIKEELMKHSIISPEEEGIEVRGSNSESKQHIETMGLTDEKESVALEDHTEASETCKEESSSITKVYEREAEAEVLKKDELTTDDDRRHVSVTVAIEETGSEDDAPEHKEEDRESDFAAKNEFMITTTTESPVLNDRDFHERQEEGSSMEKKGILEEDDKIDYCAEEADKTSTMQHEREVTTSSVSNFQGYPQKSLEEKNIYVTEETTGKAAETCISESTTKNKLLQNEDEVAKQEVAFDVETEKSNASENILEQTTEPDSNERESDAVSSANNTVNEVTATTSEAIKQIESSENFSNAVEDVSSFTTIQASQQKTQGEESKNTLFRPSLESWEGEKDTKALIIKKEDASDISEILPHALVGKDTGLIETTGEDNKQENNFAPVTEARDVTSANTGDSRLDAINTDGIQDKSSCSEKNGAKQSQEIADETVQEIYSGFDRTGGNESNDKIKEQIEDSEVKLMDLQISSARDEAADEVKDSNLSSTENLKAEDSNKQTMLVESSIKDDHPSTKETESVTKAMEEDIQNESIRRPTEVPFVAIQVVEEEVEKDIRVEEDNCFIITHTAPVDVLQVESSPKEAQLEKKTLKRSDLDDQCPESTKSLHAEDIAVKDEMASSSLIAQIPPKVRENADASKQNLAAENVDVDEADEFMQTYEVVSRDEIIDYKLLQTGDNKEFQNQTSASLERKQEQRIQVTSQDTRENLKAAETLDHNFSDSKTEQETCLEKEDSMKFIDQDSVSNIYEDSQIESSSKSHKKGEAPSVILKPCEKGEKECIDSFSESQKITEETKPEEALNLKTSEKAFEYVQEVHSDKAIIELEDTEYPVKTAITDVQPKENQSEKTIAAQKTTDIQASDEKINEEKEGGKIYLQNFLSKTHQENEPEAVDPFKKTEETFQISNNDNQNEVKSEALKKDKGEPMEDKLPCDIEGKNITEAARLENENQEAETNVTTRKVLMSQSEEEPGVKRAKGHVTKENENTQGIKKVHGGSVGKADVESKQVPQIPKEEIRLEVLPENAEPGRAIGIGIILEETEVGEEKIKHLDDVLTKKSTSMDAEKTSIFNISEKPTEEPLQAAIDLDEATDKAVSTGKDQTQEEENPHVEEDNIEVTSGATEIVESSKDVDVKVAHKKHHNILSGVGSKVKHSISKVKKAITGKSSHSKSSPK